MFIDNETYSNILHNSVIPTVDLIIINQEGKILLGLRNNAPLQGVYYIPGGRIHKNETMQHAAQRKAREELGLHLEKENLQFVGSYDDIFDNSAFEGVSSHCIPNTFVYKLSKEQENNLRAADKQHQHIQFFNFNDQSLHPFLLERLQTIQSIYHIFP